MDPFRHCSLESLTSQLDPWICSNCCTKSLTGSGSRGGTGLRRIRPERRQSMATSGGEGPWALAHPWVASVRTVVARRGLAARAGDDGRASAGGSSTRRCRQPGKRHYTHGETRGTRRRSWLGLRSDRGVEPRGGRELSRRHQWWP